VHSMRSVPTRRPPNNPPINKLNMSCATGRPSSGSPTDVTKAEGDDENAGLLLAYLLYVAKQKFTASRSNIAVAYLAGYTNVQRGPAALPP